MDFFNKPEGGSLFNVGAFSGFPPPRERQGVAVAIFNRFHSDLMSLPNDVRRLQQTFKGDEAETFEGQGLPHRCATGMRPTFWGRRGRLPPTL